MVKEEIVKLTLPYPNGKDRTVRVYVPEHEEGETLPVIYMTDGQNLFEEETTPYGSWFTHEAVKNERAQSGKAAIIVGIHNDGTPVERTNELTPASIGKMKGLLAGVLGLVKPQGEAFARFVVEVVRPAVEARFPVKTGRANTAFCGSSSGGLETFFIALTYPELFSAAGAFSPYFAFYAQKDVSAWIRRKIPSDSSELPFLYLYSGAGEAKEKAICKRMLQTDDVLRECYPAHLMHEVVKPEQLHKEAAWEPEFSNFLHLFLSQPWSAGGESDK